MAIHPTSPEKSALRLRFDRFELDESNARLMRDGKPVLLAPRAFAVLCELARTPQALMTKNALLDRVWGHRFVSDSALKSVILSLRAALDDDARKPRYIETSPRRGYRFIGCPGDVWDPIGAPAPVDPPAPADRRSPMIGRTTELDLLRAAWRRASAGARAVVLVGGEAGVGKTRLIEALISEVGEVRCAHGQCIDQHGAGEPYLPVLEALTSMCRVDASLADLMRAVAPTWLRQLPWLTTATERQAQRHDFFGEGQTRMLRELGELLDRYTQHRPLLLVTEDLHWSDPATVQLIDYFARRRSGARLLWLASFRPIDLVATDHPLQRVRRELRLHGLSEEIFLDAFSEREAAEYVARRNPSLAADETFVRALHHRTGGLPLFVADLMREFGGQAEPATGAPESARQRLASLPIPDTVHGIVERHIEQLEPVQRAVLEAACACSSEFRASTVAAALGLDVASVAETCMQLARDGRWLREGRPERAVAGPDAAFLFRHALYREVLYKRMAPVLRIRLHQRVADVDAGVDAERPISSPERVAERRAQLRAA